MQAIEQIKQRNRKGLIYKISAVCRNKYNLKKHNNYKWRFSTIEEIENAKGRNNKKG